MIKKYKWIIGIVMLLTLSGMVSSLCTWLSLSGYIEELKKGGKLVVITRNSPITYYVSSEGSAGFEYDLANAFAKHLGVKVEFKLMDSVAQILEAIEKGEGDIASASLTRTQEREEKYLFGPSYLNIQQQVVCRRGRRIPKNIEGLKNIPLLVIEKSSYEERLKELKTHYPFLKWDTTRELSTEDILEKVWEKEVPCTVADSNIVAINRRYYPELVVAFPITEEQQLAWIIHPKKKFLIQAAEQWLDDFEEENQLAILHDKYYGYVDIFNYVDLSVYRRHIKERLPTLRHLFKKAARKYDIPWSLLAAQSYQESHWNPKAKSPTGVRGVMMLTRRTAKSLGVTNRLDPRQSINGGAKYLKKMLKRLPASIPPSDRLSYALAAYNIGMAHLKDAQILAKRLNKDPSSWRELKQVLPLLSKKKYYKTLKYGYARGIEPVRYVERIYNYRDILEKYLNK